MGRKRVKPTRGLWVTYSDGHATRPTAHHYHAKVLALTEQLRAEGRLPGVSSIRVAHDDWCGIYTGKPCNCDPEVSVEWPLGAHTQT